MREEYEVRRMRETLCQLQEGVREEVQQEANHWVRTSFWIM